MKDQQLDASLINGNIYMALISLILSFLMPLFIWFYPKLRSLSYVILACIGISEVFQSLGYFLSIFPRNNYRCVIAQVFIILSDTWTMLFLFLLTYCISSLVINNDREIYKKTNRFVGIGFIGGTIYALIIILLHFLLQKHDDEKNFFCQNFIKLMGVSGDIDKTLNIARMIFYSVNWIILLFIIFYSCKISSYMKRKSQEDPVNASKIMKICNGLAYYPVFGFLGWAMTTIFLFTPSLQNNIGIMDHILLMLTYLAGILVCLRGFFIALIFFQSDKIKGMIIAKWQNLTKPLSLINYLQHNSQSNTRILNETSRDI